MFGYNLVRIGSGIVGNVFTTFVLLPGHPAGAFVWPKSQFPEILDMVIFWKSEFSSKTLFFGHLFGEMSHKIGSYGPYGPFRFSVKMRFDIYISVKISLLQENQLFQIIGKMN